MEASDRKSLKGVFLPNANIDEYYLRIYDDVPERCTTGIVGFVGNTSNPKIKFRIEIDNEWMLDHNFFTIAAYIDDDNFYESYIMMSAPYFDRFRKTDFMKFDLWHEVGHFHLGHYFDTPRNENGSYNEYRLECANRGEIMPEEKAADIFGLYYTSKDSAIAALSESIRNRRQRTWELPETTNGAIEEFRRRKRFLRDLVDDDKARAALCELCGKDNYLDL